MITPQKKINIDTLNFAMFERRCLFQTISFGKLVPTCILFFGVIENVVVLECSMCGL